MTEPKKTGAVWAFLTDIHILDPDGWRRGDGVYFDSTLITAKDFDQRVAQCTARYPDNDIMLGHAQDWVKKNCVIWYEEPIRVDPVNGRQGCINGEMGGGVYPHRHYWPSVEKQREEIGWLQLLVNLHAIDKEFADDSATA